MASRRRSKGTSNVATFQVDRGSRPRRLAAVALVPLTVLAVGLSAGGSSVASSTSSSSPTRAAAAPARMFPPAPGPLRLGDDPGGRGAVNAAVGCHDGEVLLVPWCRTSSWSSCAPASASRAPSACYAAAGRTSCTPSPTGSRTSTRAKPQSITKTPNDPRYRAAVGLAEDRRAGRLGQDHRVPQDRRHRHRHRHGLQARGPRGQRVAEHRRVQRQEGRRRRQERLRRRLLRHRHRSTATATPIDDNGHGTHTAGTIGAVGNNRIGVTGHELGRPGHALQVARLRAATARSPASSSATST